MPYGSGVGGGGGCSNNDLPFSPTPYSLAQKIFEFSVYCCLQYILYQSFSLFQCFPVFYNTRKHWNKGKNYYKMGYIFGFRLKYAFLVTFSPANYAWYGGVALSKQKNFLKKYCVTKLEYEESGRTICHQKFDEGISWKKMEMLAWFYQVYLNVFEKIKLESLVSIDLIKKSWVVI